LDRRLPLDGDADDPRACASCAERFAPVARRAGADRPLPLDDLPLDDLPLAGLLLADRVPADRVPDDRVRVDRALPAERLLAPDRVLAAERRPDDLPLPDLLAGASSFDDSRLEREEPLALLVFPVLLVVATDPSLFDYYLGYPLNFAR
jgi:hypothetical protein